MWRCFIFFGVLSSVAASVCAGGTAESPHPSPATQPYEWDNWQQFWSFRPIVKPEPPPAEDVRFSTNPIDQFIFARLNRAGLKPAPEADRLTLIRRATFDLLGLPPTAQEVHQFVADSSPDAVEKLIDRLLASPHYGERWGRHWLDVARYVPGRISFIGLKRTAGDQAYRDYVVRAFNTDKPYDQFVTEQLAGDLLPATDDRGKYFDQITAPAFLSIGSWFDECTDPNRLRMEMIDDMISTSSQAFLGLSVGCARCHDHKFDPIPTSDYYALAGIFGSTRIVGQLNNYWRDGRQRLLRPLAMPQEVLTDQRLVDTIDSLKQQSWRILCSARARLTAEFAAHERECRAAAAEAPRRYTKTFKAEDFDGEHNLRIAQLMSGGNAVNIVESMNAADEWVKYKFDADQGGRYALEALYCSDERTPLLVQVNGESVSTTALNEPTGGWDLQFERWQEVARFDLRAGLNFYRMFAKEGTFPRLDRLRLREVKPEDDALIAQLAAKYRLDPMLLRNFVRDPDEPIPRTSAMRRFCSDAEQRALAGLDRQVAALEGSRRPSDLVISVADETAPADLPVHLRGDVYDVAKTPTPRGMPRLLDHVLSRPTIPASRSGRLELAAWLTNPANPLTARVMVNRLWQWHFGRGIVASSSDFGSRGDTPSHPELLDYLARTFIERGWSIKQMQKLIMSSAAYRMSSRLDQSAEAAGVDPNNRLLAHFPRRRLEAEELYDAMLASANLVLPQPAGQPLEVEKAKNRAMYVLSSNRAPKGMGPDIRRMFPLFDYDPSGAPIAVRPVSTTPAQSLFWLNSPLAGYYAARFAERLLKMERLNDQRRVEMAFTIAFGNASKPQVTAAALAFVQQRSAAGESKAQAWAQLCQALYASEEFHYVD